jgi:hypothetical protein
MITNDLNNGHCLSMLHKPQSYVTQRGGKRAQLKQHKKHQKERKEST